MYVLGKGIVHPWLCDVMGHMNVRFYMAMFDDASYRLLYEASGWTSGSLDWQGKGWADVSHSIEYLAELKVGELTEINGIIVSVGNRSFTSLYQILNAETLVPAAQLQSKVTYFDLKERKSVQIPEEIKIRMKSRM